MTAVLGYTVPRIYTKPLVEGPAGPCGCGCALTPETTRGFEVVEFAHDVLGIDLFPWQRWFLIHALEMNAYGLYRFQVLLLLVSRQNGKSFLMTILALWKMYLDGAGLVIGTAQTLDLSEKSWDETVSIAESIPELSADIIDVVKGSGKKALITKQSTYKVASANRRGARGFSGDFILLDELREHKHWEAWNAVAYTTTARPHSQVLGLSNAGDDESVVLKELRKNAVASVDDPKTDLGIFEWSAPDHCPTDDVDALAQANPSLGFVTSTGSGITLRKLESLRATSPEASFRTESMCQWVDHLHEPVIPYSKWAACLDENSRTKGNIVISFDVTPGRDGASVAIAGYRSDGLPHVEVVRNEDGVDWLIPEVVDIYRANPGAQVVVDPGSAAGAFSVALSAESIDPVMTTSRDVANACGLLFDAVVSEKVRHIGQEALDAALRGARKRDLSDAWAWARRASGVDITPLVAITLAHWQLSKSSAENVNYNAMDSLLLDDAVLEQLRREGVIP